MRDRKQVRQRRAKKQKQRQIRTVVTSAIVIFVITLTAIIAHQSQSADTAYAGNDPASAERQARFDLDPVLGNPDAPVTIVEYAAFGCPSCRAWHQAGVIKGILAEFPDQVKFVFRDFPVILPAYDHMAAEIAQCALDQSNDAFWKLHDALYETVQPGASSDQIFAAADGLGLDTNALRTCYQAGTHRATVDYDLQRARALGLPGTPAWFVNDQRLFNATPDILRQMVAQALSGS